MNAREPLVRGKAYHAWRELAIAGFVLTLLMVVDGFVDVFRDIRVLDFETVILSIPLGMAIMYAGCIGWARYLIREKRFGITVILVVPWLLLAAFDRMGVHGPGMVSILVGIVSAVVAIVVLVTPRRTEKSTG
jgi:hypothetical protein